MNKKSGPDKAPAERVIKDIRRATRRQFSAEEKIRITPPVHHRVSRLPASQNGPWRRVGRRSC
jgi:ribosomal protein L31E